MNRVSDETTEPHLGGMALANGLLVHGPTHWAAAIRTSDGHITVSSGEKPHLAGGPANRIPLVRGLLKMAEAVAVVPAARMRTPGARLAMENINVIGAMLGSARDLLAWTHALYGGEVLSPDALAQMLDFGRRSDYGIAARRVEGMAGWEAYGHGGSLRGYVSLMVHVPEAGIDLVILTNVGRVDIERVAGRIVRAVAGEAPEPSPSPSADPSGAPSLAPSVVPSVAPSASPEASPAP